MASPISGVSDALPLSSRFTSGAALILSIVELNPAKTVVAARRLLTVLLWSSVKGSVSFEIEVWLSMEVSG